MALMGMGGLGGATGGFRGTKAALDQAGPHGPSPATPPDLHLLGAPGGGAGTVVSKPPSDMQRQGRTAPDLNRPMDGGLGAARLLGRRGSSF